MNSNLSASESKRAKNLTLALLSGGGEQFDLTGELQRMPCLVIYPSLMHLAKTPTLGAIYSYAAYWAMPVQGDPILKPARVVKNTIGQKMWKHGFAVKARTDNYWFFLETIAQGTAIPAKTLWRVLSDLEADILLRGSAKIPTSTCGRRKWHLRLDWDQVLAACRAMFQNGWNEIAKSDVSLAAKRRHTRARLQALPQIRVFHVVKKAVGNKLPAAIVLCDYLYRYMQEAVPKAIQKQRKTRFVDGRLLPASSRLIARWTGLSRTEARSAIKYLINKKILVEEYAFCKDRAGRRHRTRHVEIDFKVLYPLL